MVQLSLMSSWFHRGSGMTAQFCINLQSHYDHEIERNAIGDQLDESKPLQAARDVADFRELFRLIAAGHGAYWHPPGITRWG